VDDSRTYSWRGRSAPWPPRQGTITCTAAELSAFVEERFGAGWFVLSVRDDTGQEVAGISRPGGPRGKPSWWPRPEKEVAGG
jgi:hypothetical protein